MMKMIIPLARRFILMEMMMIAIIAVMMSRDKEDDGDDGAFLSHAATPYQPCATSC